MLQAMKDFRIRQIVSFVDEGLPNLVIRLIVQVFGSKGRLVNRHETCIICTNEMLSTNCIRLPPVSVTLAHFLRLSFGTPLPIEPSAEGVNNAGRSANKSSLSFSARVDRLNHSSLHTVKRVK